MDLVVSFMASRIGESQPDTKQEVAGEEVGAQEIVEEKK
jgi:hypothetical protein